MRELKKGLCFDTHDGFDHQPGNDPDDDDDRRNDDEQITEDGIKLIHGIDLLISLIHSEYYLSMASMSSDSWKYVNIFRRRVSILVKSDIFDNRFSQLPAKLYFFVDSNRIETEKATRKSPFKRMVWKEKIRKLGYYKDFPLLFQTLFTSLKVSLSLDSSLASLAVIKQKGRSKDKEKIIKYARFCLYLRRLLGFKDSCLTSSLLLCSLLRRYGIDARVNFSAKKQEDRMAGHCWVNIGPEEISSDYTLIFKYP